MSILAFSAAPAFAEVGHKYESQITEAPPATPLTQPWGLTFDTAGNLYAADAAAEQIDIFSPANVFASQFSEGFTPSGKGFIRSVAVNDKTGVVYVGVSEPEDVFVFKPEGAGKYKLLQKQPFSNFIYVAVDNSSGLSAGTVYVISGSGAVHVVKTNGTGELEGTGTELKAPEEGFSLLSAKEQQGGLTVDNATGVLYIANPGNKAVDEYSSEGEPLAAKLTLAGSFEPVAVAVNEETEEIYVLNAANGTVDQFSSSGEPIGTIAHTEKEAGKPEPLKEPLGIAVQNKAGATKGEVYVSDGAAKAVDVFGADLVVPTVATGPVPQIGASEATVEGTVNPDGVSLIDCHFDYGTSVSYGQTAPCEPAAGTISGEQTVTAHLTGLKPGTTYHYRLQASNADEVPSYGADAEFLTLPTPSIDSATVTNLSASSADLNAQINPHGVPTTYHFEYGTTTAYGTTVPAPPAPEPEIGEGSADVQVTQHVELPIPDTTYHWRVVATSKNGTTTSPDQTFVYAPAGAGLPDNRQYEMVTPAQKNGALIGEPFVSNLGSLERPLVARDGQRVIGQSIQCLAGGQSCVGLRASEGEPYEFARTGAGWVTHPLAPPAASFETTSWLSVNADASTALFSVPIAPQSAVDEFYANKGGSFLTIGPVGEHANFSSIESDSFISTGDLSHVVYETKTPVWSFDHGDPFIATGLYEYVGAGSAAPMLVGVKGGFEDHELIGVCGTKVGRGAGGNAGVRGRYGSLSEDGRTMYVTVNGRKDSGGCAAHSSSEAPEARQLWARIDGELPEPGKARSVLISAPTPGTCIEKECEENTGKEKESERARDAAFEGASSDGSRVFFTDTQQLTDGASQSSGQAGECNRVGGPGGCNLYESECEHCDELSESEEHSRRRLIDVSEGAKEHGGPRVQGVVASSADGSHVYFVAQGVLSGVEENQSHERAQEEADNLYVYAEGHLAFITALSPSDQREWEREYLTANVTADGRFLVFTSHRALTADDTREEGPAQVFEYDAQTRALVRVSIGEKGFNDNGNAGTGDASIVPIGPGGPVNAGSVPVRSDPTMSDDGEFVFFESPVALTPRALNDVPIGNGKLAENVYEYHEGQVSLISDGRDTTPKGKIGNSPVELLGSDTTGANVFFATFDPLLPEDSDTQRDYYDAHTCSEAFYQERGIAPETCAVPAREPAPCEGEACHGSAPGAPANLTPGSQSFTGPGNLIPSAPAPAKPKTAAQIRAEKLAKALKACRRKHNKHKRAVCEKQARKAYGAKKASKTSRKRGRG